MKLRVLLISFVVTLMPFQALAESALPEADLNAITHGTEFYDSRTFAGSCDASTVSTSGGELPAEVVQGIENLKDLYVASAQKEGLAWQVLAAIDHQESTNGPNQSMLGGEPLGTKAKDSDNTPTTKQESIDIGASRLKSLAKAVYGIDVTAATTGEELKLAILSYNRGFIYKNASTGPDASPYVMNQFDDAHKNMKWPSIKGEPLAGKTYTKYGAYTIITRLGGLSVCTGGGGVGIGDIVFPLRTTKAFFSPNTYPKSLTPITCGSTQPGGCHHDYFAADLGSPIGTQVLAAVGGTIVPGSTNDTFNGASCNGGTDVPRTRIKGDDGKWYYYTHMGEGSVQVRDGQKVSAGQPLGTVGPTSCAQNTAPHLHFDISTAENGFSRPGPDALKYLIDPMPALKSAYNGLPEK